MGFAAVRRDVVVEDRVIVVVEVVEMIVVETMGLVTGSAGFAHREVEKKAAGPEREEVAEGRDCSLKTSGGMARKMVHRAVEWEDVLETWGRSDRRC